MYVHIYTYTCIRYKSKRIKKVFLAPVSSPYNKRRVCPFVSTLRRITTWVVRILGKTSEEIIQQAMRLSELSLSLAPISEAFQLAIIQQGTVLGNCYTFHSCFRSGLERRESKRGVRYRYRRDTLYEEVSTRSLVCTELEREREKIRVRQPRRKLREKRLRTTPYKSREKKISLVLVLRWLLMLLPMLRLLDCWTAPLLYGQLQIRFFFYFLWLNRKITPN